ncbi:MBL fold metallo-hydrolase [Sulfoacidibacillus thermotolerans]|uniref:Rhodanese domain-containing protein n=1 Tax=Sulfoacidibacillus thermotolerans TaxID=1765684 RepID=A0A2U3DAI7_SULT2|nr:MBL fold metallo-hydrolase [Sulfoacidibacillus thermotolerans]PWI58299.1 hypothetical protein BM613_03490 [Sulfoacidibacillus thermotolerans]
MNLEAVTVQSMLQRMARGESFTVLDIRSKTDFQNWQLKGMSLQAVNVPYFDFKENEVNDRLLPEWSHIVLVSMYDPAAERVAAVLQDKGYKVSYLEGGPFEWDDFYVESVILVHPKMKLIQVHRLATGCLSYVLITAKQAIVVDPSRHIEQYLAIAEREHSQITHVIDTHVHTDHVSGALSLLSRTHAKYLVAHGEVRQSDLPVELLKRGTMHVGSLDIHVMILDTEGEVGGSTLLVVENTFMLSGDTVIVGEVGIADLQGSAQEWAEKIFNVVLREVKYLSDDVLVLPAHFADVQAVNAGGYIGAVLGDVRLGAEAMGHSRVLNFTHRPKGFVAALHPFSQEIRDLNLGVIAADVTRQEYLERDLRL